jgi:hypothetical protein
MRIWVSWTFNDICDIYDAFFGFFLALFLTEFFLGFKNRHKLESNLEYIVYRRKLKPTLGDQLLYKLESDIASPLRNLEVELGSL